jgi:hypothetical protein
MTGVVTLALHENLLTGCTLEQEEIEATVATGFCHMDEIACVPKDVSHQLLEAPRREAVDVAESSLKVRAKLGHGHLRIVDAECPQGSYVKGVKGWEGTWPPFVPKTMGESKSTTRTGQCVSPPWINIGPMILAKILLAERADGLRNMSECWRDKGMVERRQVALVMGEIKAELLSWTTPEEQCGI